MSDVDVAKKVIRWMMTTSEMYSKEKPEGCYSTHIGQSESFASFPNDRVNPGELFQSCFDHREERIRARQEAAMVDLFRGEE
jgi:hypothetical protein